MPFRIRCPHCQAALLAQEDLIGQEAVCHQCRRKIRVEAEALAGVGASAGDGADVKSLQPDEPPDSSATEPGSAELDGGKAIPARPALQAAVPDGAGPTRVVAIPQIDRHPVRRFCRGLLAITWPRRNFTDAGLLATGLAAAALTFLLYVGLFLLGENSFAGWIVTQGWLGCLMLGLFLWSMAILGSKWINLAGQQATPAFELFPDRNSPPITPRTVDLFRQAMDTFRLDPQGNCLDSRVSLALAHYQAGRSVGEITAVLQAQADSDSALVESSYLMPRALVRIILILGIIGMIREAGDALHGFGNSVQAAQDLGSIQRPIARLAGGLASAGGPLLLALGLSGVLLFLGTRVRQAEIDHLGNVNRCCNRTVLRCLQDDSRKPGS
jgi:hypothetical protein